jgi:hypothetical protein
MRSTNQTTLDADKLVRREALLAQLQPVEHVLQAARLEVALHRAACRAAKASGKVDPGHLADAEAAADGVEELIRRFDSMSNELPGARLRPMSHWSK